MTVVAAVVAAVAAVVAAVAVGNWTRVRNTVVAVVGGRNCPSGRTAAGVAAAAEDRSCASQDRRHRCWGLEVRARRERTCDKKRSDLYDNIRCPFKIISCWN